MQIHCDKTTDEGGCLARLLAEIARPSCEEREAAVPERRLKAWADAMARRKGYMASAESLLALRKYLAGYGLLMIGGVGVGKTAFFRAVSSVGVRRGRQPIAVWRMADGVGRSVDSIRALFASLREREVLLDDVGAEPTYNEYGNRWEMLPWLIEMRMDSPERTHFTTNLSPAEIEARYGARTVDRIHEMAASVTLGGPSRRHTRPNARAVAAWDARGEGVAQ